MLFRICRPWKQTLTPLLASRLSSSSNTLELIDKHASRHPVPVTIKQLVDFGRMSSEDDHFEFTRTEIPVRLGNIIKEMDHLPSVFLENRKFKMVRDWYVSSFIDILKFQEEDKKDPEVLRRFRRLIPSVLSRQSDVIPFMAEAIEEMRNSPEHLGVANFHGVVHYFLDRFYTSKIGMTLICNHYLDLFDSTSTKKDSRSVGSINPNCNITGVVLDAYQDAKMLCNVSYSRAPDMKLEVFKGGKALSNEAPISFSYIPSHIHHILFELLKNALRAVTEKADKTEGELIPVHVVVSQGHDDVTIKISDRGKGIPYRNLHMVFNYAYTSAKRVKPGEEESRSGSEHVPLCGFGYGLPLARLYARYFHGDIVLSSVEAYGTDAYVYLRKQAVDAAETVTAFSQEEAQKIYGENGKKNK